MRPLKVLISAGPTREAIDPVRFISNKSTGRMGYALAASAVNAGFSVTLVSGPVTILPPQGLAWFIPVVTAAQMADAVKSRAADSDLVIMCAAVADFRPVHICSSKIKKDGCGMTLELEPTEDILASLGAVKRPGQILCGFAAETDGMERNALAKMKKKHLDWIAANEVGLPDRGFASDNNSVTLYSSDGRVIEIPLSSKQHVANEIIKYLTGK